MNEIEQAFMWLENTNPTWLRAIENRRTGSNWGCVMPWQMLAALPWQKLPDSDRVKDLHSPECDYYHVVEGLPFAAVENVKMLPEFETFETISIVQEVHGTALVSSEVEPKPTNEAWLIIGPDKLLQSERVVYTAYPGRYGIVATKHPLWNGKRDCFQAIASTGLPVAVKGLNEARQDATN